MKNRLKKVARQKLAESRSGLLRCKANGANEENTIQYIYSILHDALGYSWDEVDAQFCVNGKKCDIALWCGDKRGTPVALIECKKASDPLRSSDVTNQVKNYGYEGKVKWVVLTNGLRWLVYEFRSRQFEEAFKIDIEDGISQTEERGFVALSREHICDGALAERRKMEKAKADTFNEFTVAQLIAGNDMMKHLASALRKMKFGYKFGMDELRSLVVDKVVRPELLQEVNTRSKVKAAKKLVSVTDDNASRGDFSLVGRAAASAKGRYTGEGKKFLVYAGAAVAEPMECFAKDGASKTRSQLERDGVIAEGRLTRDWVFNSPSQAAAVIKGAPGTPSSWRQL